MTANINPIYSRLGSVATDNGTGMSQLVTAAANDYTGISANNVLLFTADPTNGSFVQRIRFKAGGTNSSASVARIYINNGSVHTTATNNAFYGEVSLQATTATIVAATVEIDYPMGFALPPGYMLYWGLGTAVTAGWVGIAIAGVY
jgi:hypothetical protein